MSAFLTGLPEKGNISKQERDKTRETIKRNVPVTYKDDESTILY